MSPCTTLTLGAEESVSKNHSLHENYLASYITKGNSLVVDVLCHINLGVVIGTQHGDEFKECHSIEQCQHD
jgi:hypothetical protein